VLVGGDVECCVVADEGADTADFDSSKLLLRIVSTTHVFSYG